MVGCTTDVQKELIPMFNKLCIPEERFFQIKFGLTFSKVKTVLGDALRHEFTIKLDNSVYMLTDCCIAIGNGVHQWLLFHNDILVNLPAWVPPTMEELPYETTSWRRVKSWNIDDLTRAKSIVYSPIRTFDKVRAYLDSVKKDSEDRSRTWNTILPMWLYMKTMKTRIIGDYKTNLILLRKYDGCKAKIGMSIDEIQALYGRPTKTFHLENGKLVHIYGEHHRLEVNPEFRYSYLAVEFDNKKTVVMVLSHNFFNKEWLSGVNLNKVR